ncbi:MAG: C_GCAxxG_C_C family protein [Clostridia bacterium]|nr:C_GCAxxG_C_C family protein [Clostridia bacterium]
MAERAERARELFLEGYNCAQAVVGAFSDRMDLRFEDAMKLSSSFGGGMGRLREVCGAVSGMFLVAGYLKGYSDPKAKEEKTEHYRLIQTLAEKFRKETGSIICRELLGEGEGAVSHVPSERTPAYYKKRPCAELVYMAAAILEKELEL